MAHRQAPAGSCVPLWAFSLGEGKVTLPCGYLKDGYMPVIAEITYDPEFPWPDNKPTIIIKFSNCSDEYIINAHRLVDCIRFLSGE